MTKKRRTRKEKIVASSQSGNYDFVFDIDSTIKTSKIKSLEKSKPDNNYTYVLKDARNTLLVTIAIIAANLLLFIALKQGYIDLFGLKF